MNPTVATVGFSLCALIGLILLAAWWTAADRDDGHDEHLAAHDEQLALLFSRVQGLADWLGVEIDDAEDDAPTESAPELELPAEAPSQVVEPITEPIDAAIEAGHRELNEAQQRNADWVEEQMSKFDFSGRNR